MAPIHEKDIKIEHYIWHLGHCMARLYILAQYCDLTTTSGEINYMTAYSKSYGPIGVDKTVIPWPTVIMACVWSHVCVSLPWSLTG